MTHVKYDTNSGKLLGLPQEWKAALDKQGQFGVPATLLEGVRLHEYNHPIPRILVALKHELYQLNGLSQQGIFRLAPDAVECERVKSKFNVGEYGDHGCVDPNVFATLIKQWLRQMPSKIFAGIDIKLLEQVQNEQQAHDLLQAFPEPKLSILQWVLDICVDVSAMSEKNLMTPKNMSVCVGPNMYDPSNPVPKDAKEASALLAEAKSHNTFLELAIKYRQLHIANTINAKWI